jgi:hypothetical protein
MTYSMHPLPRHVSTLYSYLLRELYSANVRYESPAIVALNNGTSTSIYVSWNGDTETQVWRFYGTLPGGKLKFLGEEKRTGFETALTSAVVGLESVRAEALSHDGRVLVTTDLVRSEVEILPYQAPEETGLARVGLAAAFQKVWSALRAQEL